MQLKKETTVGIFIILSISSFLFMSYRIGFFKFDKMNYAEYTANLKTATGLLPKAEVKIAGVKIGWIESLDISSNGLYVDAKLMLLKKYKLYSDAEILIRQDGPLGTKFIEINPGHANNPILPEGSIISDLESKQPSLDDIFSNVATITQTLTEFMKMLKDPAQENMGQLQAIINDCGKTVNNLSFISQKLENFFLKHDDSLVHIGSRIPDIIEKAENMVTNVSGASASIKAIADKVNNLTHQAKDNKNFFQKTTTESNPPFLTNLISRADRLLYCLDQLGNVTVGLDNNYEFLMNHRGNKNFKSLFNLWVHPSSNYFFIGGVNFSKNGFVKRSVKVLHDDQGCVKFVNSSKIKKNTFGLNLQAGGYFKNFMLRVGLFESTPGLAFDWLLPFGGNKFKWISSFEAFDFTGKNKVHGYRYNPHVKWMNRVYFSPNFYLTFGADDFANREKRFGFIGLGLNFGSTYFRDLFC